MENKKFKPLVDKYFYAIWIPMAVLMLALTAISLFEPTALIIMLATDAFTFYFLVSSLIGYVELRGDTLFVKFGFILKREIPYCKIRSLVKDRRVYSESMLSLKNSLEHVNIKYNRFDVISVSVVDNDGFIKELEERIAAKSE